MICIKCSRIIPDDSVFCQYCGLSINSQNNGLTLGTEFNNPKVLPVTQEVHVNKQKKKKSITSMVSKNKRVLLLTIPIILILIFGLLFQNHLILSLKDEVKSQKLNDEVNKTAIAELSEKYSNLQHDYDDLLSEYNNIESEYWLISEKAEFLDSRIVFVVDDKNSKYYHCYDCDYFSNSKEFWAYNVENAEYLGHYACPYCH